uniref:Aldehyde dehydrogenase domain-containing protein n=1 Tax=Eutreptiella gymnastica TaxID=73025 RepID=A0A7S1NJ85_9EUGL|mmetsp:Transcript_46892/g.84084  ORF Transcript_46892/g.84084 Transcript_46892/m.84084 type:complete len:521 (+) Transcript_46892:20-1582(+)
MHGSKGLHKALHYQRITTLPPTFKRQGKLFINNEFVQAKHGAELPVLAPRDGQVFAAVANASKDDVDKAVKAAKECFSNPEWRDLAPSHRSAMLRSIGDQLKERSEEFAVLESLDCGKPISEARADMDFCAGVFHYYANLVLDAIEREPLHVGDPKFASIVHKGPIGPVACITPWNYPLMQATMKVAPALAAGCTAVLKPSPLASLTCLQLGELVQGAGLPPGALNVITGGPPNGDAGSWLASHPDIAKLSFTGSSMAGKALLHASADLLRPTALELGGKGCMIVFEDAHIESAVDWCMYGIFTCAGQICSANSRALVHRSVAKQFMDRLAEETRRIKVGDPSDEGTKMGPVISAQSKAKILTFLQGARSQGCQFVAGGSSPDVGDLHGGYYVEPTVLANVPVGSAIWNEEIFGPVLAVNVFDTEDEAIVAANATRYGLADSVMTKDHDRLQRVADRLQSGTVWQNCSQFLDFTTPFGGAKQSGFGREYGAAGLDEYLQHKTVTSAEYGHSWNWFVAGPK